MKYKLIIITVTYKPNLPELYAYVDSFIKYNDLGKQAKLVVVDNSPIGTWNVAVFCEKYPSVAYLASPDNPGFGAANNKGFELFDSDYVLFMNNDAEFTESVFVRLIDRFESDLQIGCIGIHQTGGSPSFFVRSESLLSKNELRMRARANDFDPVNFFLSGAFLMLSSKAFREVGEFDPKIFMYCEESDLINRLLEHKYKVQYIHTLSFLHKVGSRKKIDEHLYGEVFSNSYCYYLRKYNYENHKHLYFSRYWIYYKRIIYFLFLFDFKEIAKLFRIMNKSTRIYKNYFSS